MTKIKTNRKQWAGVALGLGLLAGAASLSVAFANDSKMCGGMSCCQKASGEAGPGAISSSGTPAKAKQGQATQSATIVIDGGYKPSTVTVQSGKPVRLTFASKGEGCANTVNIPALKQSFTLKKGQQKTIVFTPKKGKALNFACGMGMYQGKVIAK